MEKSQGNSFTLFFRHAIVKLAQKIFHLAYYLLTLGAGAETMDKVESAEAQQAAGNPDDSQLWLIMGLQSGTLTFYGFAGDDKGLHTFKYKKVQGTIMFCKNLIELRQAILTNFAGTPALK
jgi:hypothetical protein